jgi:DNA-binding SARP family transcriptional activator/class 3 adenylate cyclase
MSQTTGNEEPSPAEGSLEVRVLGEFTVLRDGETVDLPPSRKTRALLAYLAVVDRSQQRERLCRMFWDLPDDPRGALRWSLSKLRQIMNNGGRDCLVADRNSVLVRGREIVLDLRRLKTIATRDVATVATAELEDAATLLRGGFLDDLSLPRCPEFEAWRTSHINDVDLHRVKILRTLVDRLAGEPSRALCYAHALQAIHPRDGALAAEVTTLAERARAHAATTPVPRPPDDGREPPAAEAPPAPPVPDRSIVVDASPADGDAERKHVTVLSVEIVSPLHAFALMDPELVSRQMDPLLDSAIRIVEQHGGIVSAFGDTGVTAVFGTLPGGEHHAVAACRTAMMIKSTIETQSQDSVRVRAGLDTGEVIVRRRRRGDAERIDVSGGAVRSAARLARSLRRGALAATDRTRAAVAGVIGMVRLPRADAPGFDRDQQAYELQAAG